jgi:hypothetical protein
VKNELDIDVKLQKSAYTGALFLLTTRTREQAPYNLRKYSDWIRRLRKRLPTHALQDDREELSVKSKLRSISAPSQNLVFPTDEGERRSVSICA